MFQKYEKDYVSKLTEEVIRNNFKIVAEMEPVAIIRKKVLDRYEGKPNKQILDYFKELDKVAISNYGEVLLTRKSADEIVFHSLTSLKAEGLGAIKEVLENGKAIYYKTNYKGLDKDRLDIAAPISIEKGQNKGNYIMAVGVVVTPPSNRVSLVELAIEKEPYDSTISNQLPTHGSGSSSILTLLQQVIDVKNGTLSLDQVTTIGIDSK